MLEPLIIIEGPEKKVRAGDPEISSRYVTRVGKKRALFGLLPHLIIGSVKMSLWVDQVIQCLKIFHFPFANQL